MKKMLLVLLTLGVVVVKAQELKQGYGINNQGDTLYGAFQIPDSDEFTSFRYQKETGNFFKFSINEIQRIVLEDVEYVRFLNVPVDQSPTRPDKIAENAKPVIVQKDLFLRQVVFGKLPLFTFVDDNLKEHYYIKVNGELIELIRRKETVPGTYRQTFRVIDKYKGQLAYALRDCEEVKPRIQQTQYSLKSISQLVFDYNQCFDGSEQAYLKGENRIRYTLDGIAEIGYMSSAFPIDPASVNQYSDFSGIGYRVSVEGVANPLQRKMQFALELGFQQRLLTAIGESSIFSVRDKLTLNQVGLMPSIYFGRRNTSERLKVAFQLGLRVDMIFVSERSRVFDFTSDGAANQEIKIPNLDDTVYEAGVLVGVGIRKGKYSAAIRYLRGGGLIPVYITGDNFSDNVSLAVGMQLIR
jgi:hypothetical protein